MPAISVLQMSILEVPLRQETKLCAPEKESKPDLGRKDVDFA